MRPMHTSRLPAFAGLLAFDAVARHGTVGRAAEALGLSQPATSRRILGLEADLGVPLFDRRKRPIELTRDGQDLYEALRSGLSRIEQTVARLRREPERALTISAGAGFSTYWLIPRLARMQALFPTQALQIVSQSHDREADSSGDLQIRFGDGDWPDCAATPLFPERVFPVASPLLLKGARAQRTQAILESHPLLDMRVRQQPWFDWPQWLAATATPMTKRAQILYFDSYPLVVSATLAGQGICLCWDGLLDEFLKSGALLRIGTTDARSARGYYITHRLHLPSEHPARRMATWLIEDAGLGR